MELRDSLAPVQPAPVQRSAVQRFACIINALYLAIQMRRDTGSVAPPVAMLLWARLGYLQRHVTRLAERIAAGKGPGVPRPRRTPPEASEPQGSEAPAPRPPALEPGPDRQPRPRPEHVLPRGACWLIRLVPDAIFTASQLQHLLTDPEMTALIAAAPQMGRLLRPFCRALGLDVPPGLRLPPRPPREPKPRKPREPRPAPANGAAAWRSRRVRKAAWPGLHRPNHEHGPSWMRDLPSRLPAGATRPPPDPPPDLPALPAVLKPA